jgi:uncharacterized membrane protein HdeD (DUF308 family)
MRCIVATVLRAGSLEHAQAELHALRANWGWFLALGIALIVVGLLAVSMAVVATWATMVLLGVLLLVGAGAEFASAIWARRWQGLLLHLLVGVVYAVLGFLVLNRPLMVAEALTLLFAALLLVGGVFRVVIAAGIRFHNWGWAVAGGLISILLGVMIWQQWPESGLWVIGLFVGIDMLFNGWTWVVLGLTLRRLPTPAV